jgi:N-acetylmuramoyl-L-alanine amidase
MTGGLLSTSDNPPPAPRHSVIVPAPGPAAIDTRPTTTVNRAANVRAMPSTKSGTILTLARNAKVTVLQQQGNWTLVEIPAQGAAGNAQQGWVFSPYLGEKKAETSPPVNSATPAPVTPAPAVGAAAGTADSSANPPNPAPADASGPAVTPGPADSH